ncbi:MAG: flagellar motor switch protein FliM [Deltaproteobacteria bacterium]|nr:flagellar motor switch protein FliM [Deltaproteobacteria bacterium]
MTDVLSQNEVDSLLEGISKGKVEVETDTPQSTEGIEDYDFRKQTRPIHLQLPGLETVSERFTGLLKTSLSVTTGSAIDVTMDGIESLRFSVFCRGIPLPASLNIFKMEPLRGYAMLVMEGTLVFSFIDTLFGGKPAGPAKLAGKSFTPIEVKMIEKISRIILGDLQQAWSTVQNMEMTFVRSEVDPQFAGIAGTEEMVVVIKFTVDLESFSGTMTLCIPYATIEPLTEKLRDKFQGEKPEVERPWRKGLEEKMGNLPLEVTCILGTTKITGRDLLEMKTDDIIQLDQKITDQVIVTAQGIPKFKGYPGTYNKKKAVRLEGRIDKG